MVTEQQASSSQNSPIFIKMNFIYLVILLQL